MNKKILAFVQATLLTATAVMPSFAAQAQKSAAEEEALKKDLTAVIALQSLPCEQVVEVKTVADMDYNVTCKDKNKYHVFLNDKGRVIVEKTK